jgi:hypothetical protein
MKYEQYLLTSQTLPEPCHACGHSRAPIRP